MWRGKLSGLMIGAVALVAVVGSGDAAETTVKASAPIKGEGRFYKIGDNQLVFLGYFQGNVEVEDQLGDLHEAGLVCPGLMEIDRTAGTQQGEGRCIIATQGRRVPLCPLDLHGQTGGGVWRALHHHRRHREVQQGSGESQFWMRSNVVEVVTTVPEHDVTASFTGHALWEALKYTTP